jgi:hypothetical protein
MDDSIMIGPALAVLPIRRRPICEDARLLDQRERHERVRAPNFAP